MMVSRSEGFRAGDALVIPGSAHRIFFEPGHSWSTPPRWHANIDRLRRFMDEHDLSAVIARSGVNFTYLSGVAYAGTLARHLDLAESPRPVFVVWPRSGDPVLIVNPASRQNRCHRLLLT